MWRAPVTRAAVRLRAADATMLVGGEAEVRSIEVGSRCALTRYAGRE